MRWVPCRRGLFERHRLIFALQLTLNVLLHAAELTRDQIELLVKPPSAQATNPVDGWLTDSAWCSVVGLSQLDAFASLRGSTRVIVPDTVPCAPPEKLKRARCAPGSTSDLSN